MALNKLEGTWKVMSYTHDNITETPPSGTEVLFIFDDCNAKDATCGITLRTTANGVIAGENSSTYIMSSDGKKITTDGEVWDINKLTKKDFELEREDNSEKYVLAKK